MIEQFGTSINMSYKLTRFVVMYIPDMLGCEDFDHAALHLAHHLCKQLNGLVELHPDTAEDILALMAARIMPSPSTASHPHIQFTSTGEVGFLGILNGALGGAARIEAIIEITATEVQDAS